MSNYQFSVFMPYFYMPGEDPYFISYKIEGTAGFNRFNGSGQSWQLEAEITLAAEAVQLLPISFNGENDLLIYGGKK